MKSIVDAEVIEEVLEARDEVVDEDDDELTGRRKPVLGLERYEDC
jgi:hypothetical protein